MGELFFSNWLIKVLTYDILSGSWSFAGSNAGIDIGLASSNFLKDDSAGLVNDLEGGHSLDGVLLGNVGVLVNINLDEVHSLLMALLNNVGGDGSAGSAPGGVEVDQALVGILEHSVELLGGISVV